MMILNFRINIAQIFLIVVILFPYFSFETRIDRIKLIDSYADGTILFEAKYSYGPRLATNFQLLHPNGTFTFINNIIIPCILCNYKVFRINPNYILISNYKNYEKSKREVGMIINWNNVISTFKFYGRSITTSNKNVSTFLSIYNKGSELLYAEYEIRKSKVSRKMKGKITINERENGKNATISSYKTFPLTDNTWGIIYRISNRGLPGVIIFTIIPKESEESQLKLSTRVELENLACVADRRITNRYYCLYATNNDKLVWNNISYHPETNKFNATPIDITSIYDFEFIPNITTLPDVGFLMKFKKRIKYTYYLLNSEINPRISQTLGEWITKNHNNSLLLPNKTITFTSGDKSFGLSSFDLSSNVPESNNFGNFHIKQTYPLWNATIQTGSNRMNITFVHPINLNGSVYASIYQVSKEEDFLRQKYICAEPFCKLLDEYSINMTIKTTTFNVPGATYYVRIDDHFANYKTFDKPMPGIKKGDWPIHTFYEDQKNVVDSGEEGTIRLKLDGTNFYQHLRDDDKREFIKQMINQISKSIPVDNSRLSHSYDVLEYDQNSDSYLLIFTFNIKPPSTTSFNQKSSHLVFNDFKELIRVSDGTTSLDMHNYTAFIDKPYGLRNSANLSEEIKGIVKDYMRHPLRVVITVVCLIFLIGLYIFGRHKYKPGRNLIVFQVVLILFDMVNDISFIINHKDNLQVLLIPSIIFVCVPFLINTFLALNILLFEIKQNPKFDNWFKNNSRLAAIITLFSSGNVDLLHLLDSNFAGFEIFSAPFSKKGLTWIFWGTVVNIFTEDLPQLIIQIIFAIQFSSAYNSVALLTLISSSVVLATGIIGFIYDYASKRYKRRQNTIDTSISHNDQEKDIISNIK